MARRFLPNNVRTRLTLAFAGALSVVLAAYSAVLLVLYRNDLYAPLDLALRGHVEAVDDALAELLAGHDTALPASPDDWLTELWTPSGKRVYTSGVATDLPLGPLDAQCAERYAAFDRVLADGLAVRIFCRRSATSNGYVIRAGRIRERIEAQVHAFGALELAGMPLVVLLSAGLGYILARRVLAPIALLTAAARTITASRLADRLPVHDPDDELGQLAATFNTTFKDLERAFQQMRRFTSDASHELRTPLTAIRTMGEVALRTRGTSTKDPYDTIGSILEEARHLQHLCESLLLLSRADAGQQRLERAPTDMQRLVAEVVELLGVLAEEKGQRIEVDAPRTVVAKVDAQLVKQALGNLLDNAIKYSPAGTLVRVAARDDGVMALLSVRDQGPGVPSEHRAHIFERFYRVDAARGRHESTSGVGLGLSIALWAVELHGGRIHVVSTSGEGSEFTIELPKEPR